MYPLTRERTEEGANLTSLSAWPLSLSGEGTVLPCQTLTVALACIF